MNSRRPSQLSGDPQFESLELRLLLSAGASLEPLAAIAQDMAMAVVTPVPEAESTGGAANDDMAGAQALVFSYILPNVSLDDGFGPQQAAVTGTADGVGGGESFYDSILIFGYISYPNTYPVEFSGAIAPGGAGVLTITAKADLEGPDKFLSLDAEGIDLGDLFVVDGENMVTVSTDVVVSQDQLAALTADGVVSLTLTPSPAVAHVSLGYVKAELSYSGPGGGGTADYYSLELGAGESASVAVAGADELTLELVDIAGEVLAEGTVVDGQSAAVIEDFHADQAGTYFVRLAGSGDYSLVVNRNAAMDLEDNDTIASAQEIHSAVADGRQWVIGMMGAADSDVYAVTAARGSVLKLRAHEAGPNGLVPDLRLFDADGSLIATGDTVGNSGASALSYRVPRRGRGAGGVYYVEVTSSGAAGGHYALSVKGQTSQPTDAVAAAPGLPARLAAMRARVLSQSHGKGKGRGNVLDVLERVAALLARR